MANPWIAVAVCTLSLACTLIAAPVNKGLIQKICDKNDDNLLKDLAKCHEIFATDENKRVGKLCGAEIAPETNGDTFKLSKKVCQDLSVIDSMVKCFKKHNQDSTEMKDMGKAAACIFTAFMKNDYMDLIGD
ncbi:uncharacterized protein [Parasteatoda tepidariorum]|uniref:uncharacterized protein n=1 Tax=Parasteatoda tepidariorum TaxID=114398 RepID=UPI00077F80DB|nr:uncharacterized protein LOC107451413 [Parasteatoda tepidariorum]